MTVEKNLKWFKEIIGDKLGNYEIRYTSFEKGDFGTLDQIEFNNEKQGGSIDFWSSGWIGIHLFDYVAEEELINLLLEPYEKKKINDNLEKLISLL